MNDSHHDGSGAVESNGDPGPDGPGSGPPEDIDGPTSDYHDDGISDYTTSATGVVTTHNLACPDPV